MHYLAEFWQDLRYGARMLAGSAGFTAVALISLSLGVAIATAAYSELNGLVLRDVPGISRPGELVMLESPSSYPQYQRYRESKRLFSSTTAYVAPVPFGVSMGGHAERIWGHLVAPSYFATLGVRPLLGRLFDDVPETPGQAPTVVVSYRFWQQHLGSATTAIGKTLRVNGQACTIAGVGPKEFQGASPMIYSADLWMPIWADVTAAPELADNALERRDRMIFHVVGRLLPGVREASAEAELDTAARQLEQAYGEEDKNEKGRRITLLPAGKMFPVRKQDLPLLTGFLTVLGSIVLLIACSNVANMMLARSADRRKEIAVRLTLGASRGRLIRQLMTENMLLAGGAGVLGFAMAAWLMRLSSQIKLPYPMPLHFNFEVDGRVLLFTTVLTALAGFAFGLVPAFGATRTDLTPALKEGGAVRLTRYRRLSLRNMLILSQVAGSLALLLITGFLVIGHQRMAAVEVGFDARNLYMISLDPLRDSYTGAQSAAFFEKLLDRVRATPSILAASLADSVPMSMIGKPFTLFAVPGEGKSQVLHHAWRYDVGKEYFDTIGIPIIAGRSFRKEDEVDGAKSVIVSERLVRDCWNGQDPLGRQIEIGNDDVPTFRGLGSSATRREHLSSTARKYQVVGVARDVRDGLVMVAADAPAVMYLPLRPSGYARPSLHGMTLIARSTPGVDAISAIRRDISAIDTNVTPFNARSMPEQISQMMFPVRAALWTYGCIGICGLILAAVGLAGVTAYSVTQRRREIGIRMALGARSADVLGLVLREGATMVVVGTGVGLGIAWAVMRVLSAAMSQIARTAGTSTSDPALLLGAPLLLATLALIACYVPARKSTRIDPVLALRQE